MGVAELPRADLPSPAAAPVVLSLMTLTFGVKEGAAARNFGVGEGDVARPFFPPPEKILGSPLPSGAAACTTLPTVVWGGASLPPPDTRRVPSGVTPTRWDRVGSHP
jgi:hypothetical protein